MNTLLKLQAALLVALLFPVGATARSAADQEKTARAVVTIEKFDAEGKGNGHGSGFVVRPDGIVATNEQVIRGAARAEVVFANGKRWPVVGVEAHDAASDIAVLKIEGGKHSALTLATGEAIIVSPVVAAGAPIDLPNTFTADVLSAWRQEPQLQRSVIQHTATIAPGSSGGPLLDESGRVLGINTYMKGPFYFAIPAQCVRQAVERSGPPRSLATLRDGQALRLARTLAGRVANDDLYHIYEDEPGFRIRLPRGYVVSRKEWADTDEYSHVTLVATPPGLQTSARINWLAQGIRMDSVLPRRAGFGRALGWRNDPRTP